MQQLAACAHSEIEPKGADEKNPGVPLRQNPGVPVKAQTRSLVGLVKYFVIL